MNLPSISGLFRRWAIVLVSSCVVSFVSTQSLAQVTVVAEDVVIASDSVSPVTGYLNVFIDYVGSGLQLGAYNFRLDLDGSALGDVAFEQAVESNTALTGPGPVPHFPGQNPLEFSPGGLPGLVIQVADNLPGLGQETPLFDGGGLAAVEFTVQPGVQGLYPVLFDQGGFQETFLFDGMGTPIPQTVQVGSIRVIPEPAFGSLTAILCLAVVTMVRRRSLI